MEFQISLAHDESNKQLEGQELAQFVEDFKATASDDEVRTAFAASLSVPVLRAIAPQTSVRNIFAVDEIPAGALAEYPIDLDDIEVAVVMPRLGAVPQNIVVGDSLQVPTWEVANSVEWRLTFVRDGRFNVVERILEKFAESFVRYEEKAGWDTIRGAVDTTNTIEHAGADLTKELFNDMITEMRAVSGYTPNAIYMSPRRAKDLRNWADLEVDPITRREIFQAGGMGSIWGVQIIELRTLGDKEIFMFDTSRVGVMPIRTKLTTYDDPTAIKKLRAGIGAYEEIGFAVIDKKAILKVNING